MRRNWHTGRGILKELNVESAVDEEVIANVEDHCTSDSAVTRAEVEKAVGKLKNGKAAGGDEVVASW